MFWLFRRKKVADKKTITPCVCENGAEGDDAYTLHEFSGFTNYKGSKSTSEGALSKLSLGENRGPRKGGYQRLQGEGSTEDPPPPSETPSSSSSSAAATQHSASSDIKMVKEPKTQVSQSLPSTSAMASSRLPPILQDFESGSSSTDYSDDYGLFTSDDDEDLTCNVCDRAFYSIRLLLEHQQKKRHYGCSICDSIFPNLMALELHKETLDHWSSDELTYRDTDSDDDGDDDYYDNVYDSVQTSRELERLL